MNPKTQKPHTKNHQTKKPCHPPAPQKPRHTKNHDLKGSPKQEKTFKETIEQPKQKNCDNRQQTDDTLIYMKQINNTIHQNETIILKGPIEIHSSKFINCKIHISRNITDIFHAENSQFKGCRFINKGNKEGYLDLMNSIPAPPKKRLKTMTNPTNTNNEL